MIYSFLEFSPDVAAAGIYGIDNRQTRHLGILLLTASPAINTVNVTFIFFPLSLLLFYIFIVVSQVFLKTKNESNRNQCSFSHESQHELTHTCARVYRYVLAGVTCDLRFYITILIYNNRILFNFWKSHSVSFLVFCDNLINFLGVRVTIHSKQQQFSKCQVSGPFRCRIWSDNHWN